MEGLQEFFRSGANMIEQSILKELYVNLGLKYKSREDYRFIDYIDDLENVYHATKKSAEEQVAPESASQDVNHPFQFIAVGNTFLATSCAESSPSLSSAFQNQK